MNKLDYISLISKRGDRYGYNGGVYDLLSWSGKLNTVMVTESEAKDFWEHWPNSLSIPDSENDFNCSSGAQ